MIKLLIAFLLLTLPAFATVNVVKFPSGTPVSVCTPSDSNSKCGGGSGGSGTPGGAQGDIQFLDVQGTLTNFGGNSGFIYTGKNSTAGNVGIGSATPGQVLDVQGTTRTKDFIASGPVADVRSFVPANGGGPGTGTDSEPAIAACLASSAGTCYLSPGVWTIGSTVSIPGNGYVYGTNGKLLSLDNGAIIKPSGNFDVVHLVNGSFFKGGTIDTSAVVGYTSSAIGVIAGASVAIDYGGASDFFLHGGTASSITTGAYGIKLTANANSASVEFMTFKNFTIMGYGYPIFLQATQGHTGSNNVNGNIFSNFYIYGGIDEVHVEGYGSAQTVGNKFIGGQLENSDTTNDVNGLYSSSTSSYFDLFPTDYEGSGTQSIFNLTSNSLQNVLLMDGDSIKGNAYSNFTDAGTENNLITGTKPIFHNLATIEGGSGDDYLQFNGYSANGWLLGQVPVVTIHNQDYSLYDYGISNNALTVQYTSGNVGIGTVNPGQILDVAGKVRMTGFNLSASPTNNYVLTSDASGNGTWKISSGSQTPWASAIDGGGNSLANTGNIGIGVTPAAEPLDVQASTSGYAALIAQSGSGNGLYISPGSDTNPALTIANTAESVNVDKFLGNGNVLLSLGGGNVGIGSSAPGQLLDVNGSLRTKSFNLSTSPTNNYVLTSDANGNGTWQAAAGGSSQWTGTAGSPIYYVPDVSIGTSQSANLLDVAGGVSIGTTYAGYKTAPSNGLIVQGNVGIGTTVAGEGLVVTAANMRIDTAKTLKWGSDVGLTGNTAGAGYVTVLGQPLSANTTQIYRMEPKGTPANGSLFGVGNLKSSFEIFGSDLAADSSNYDRFMVMNGSTAIGFMDGASGTAIYKPILFGQYNEATTAVTEFVRFDTTGNVGIGSTAPGQKLDVNGTVRSTGFTQRGTSPDNFTGNVGIGSATPGQALDVKGNIRGQNGGNVNYQSITCGNSTTPGTAVAIGTTPSYTYPTAGKIISATLSGTLSASTCTCTVDVWKANASIPTVSSTITAAALPALSSASYEQDTILSGWTTSIAANDVIMCNVQSGCTCDNWNLVMGVAA